MSRATNGAEAIWKGRSWMFEGFDKLTTTIVRKIAGTFRHRRHSGSGHTANEAALDRRRERLLMSIMAASADCQRKRLPPSHARTFNEGAQIWVLILSFLRV
jgi:hypothetical protein